jgi:hypothetical protein
VDHHHCIQDENLQSIFDLAFLNSDSDMTKMAKCLSSHTVQEGRVHLFNKIIKKIQALVYWVKDCHKCGVEVTAEKWNENMLNKPLRLSE